LGFFLVETRQQGLLVSGQLIKFPSKFAAIYCFVIMKYILHQINFLPPQFFACKKTGNQPKVQCFAHEMKRAQIVKLDMVQNNNSSYFLQIKVIKMICFRKYLFGYIGNEVCRHLGDI